MAPAEPLRFSADKETLNHKLSGNIRCQFVLVTEDNMRVRIWISPIITLALMALASFAHEGHEEQAPVSILKEIGDVGDVSFSVSCKGEGLQARFDRAVALLNHMT